jgi:Chromo (CHRromatin Organisation MOdifier) domain
MNVAPFELILSRPPPILSVGPSEAEVQDTPASAKLHFTTRVNELVPLAQTRLAEAQAQYKRNFDRSIKEKTKTELSGSCVYLRREVREAGRNPKLDDQVDGPYQLMETYGRVFKLRIGYDDVPVSSGLITPAPVSDPEFRSREDPIDETARSVADEYDEEEKEGYDGSPTDKFVFERIAGMKKLNDGTLRYNVRWYGYGLKEDTWEPSIHLPAASLRRYYRKIGWNTSK